MNKLNDINKSATIINTNIALYIYARAARHNFATSVTLPNGIPIESVSKTLDHKSIKTTLHYISKRLQWAKQKFEQNISLIADKKLSFIFDHILSFHTSILSYLYPDQHQLL